MPEHYPADKHPPDPDLEPPINPYLENYASHTENVDDIKKLNTRISEITGIKETDTGLAPLSQWDLVSDEQMMQEEQPLQASPFAPNASPRRRAASRTYVTPNHSQVARCTKIIDADTENAKYHPRTITAPSPHHHRTITAQGQDP